MNGSLAGRVALVGLGVGVGGVGACGSASYAYVAQAYRAEGECLGPPVVLDVVAGDPPGSCPRRCIVKVGTRDVHVSTVCGPAPPGYDASGADPLCAAALAAPSRGEACAGDGGSAS